MDKISDRLKPTPLEAPIRLEVHNGIHVLRDDLLPGGTKYVLMPHIVTDEYKEFVYASPVYGAFQISLSIYCKEKNKQATIFCARRATKHKHTLLCESLGAKIVEVPNGYLTVVEKHARDYCEKTGAKKIEFGGHSMKNRAILTKRARDVFEALGFVPENIWCAVGSGLLMESLLDATLIADAAPHVNGVVVGRGESFTIVHPRGTLYRYDKPFDYETKYPCPFQSMPNYDRKAWEYCNEIEDISTAPFFWNVY